MKIIPLGSNGWFGSFNRETACYLLPFDDTLIVLDAGSGLFRLTEDEGQKLLAEAKEVHIFLSHYHLDHTFGFYAAFKLLEGKKVTVFSLGGKKVFKELINLGYFPIDYEKIHKNFTFKNIDEGKYRMENYQVSVMRQNHRGETSLSFRFILGKKDIAYVTDGEPKERIVQFLKNTQVLLHEHWYEGKLKNESNLDLSNQVEDGHVTTIGACLIAKKANVEKLYLIHHNPFASWKQLERQKLAGKNVFPRTYLAKDLKEIIL